MKIRKRFFSLLLSLTMIIGLLSACHKEEELVPCTLDEILSSFSDETNFDELMALDEEISLEENEVIQKQNFSESITKLEEYLDLISRFNALGIPPTPLYTHTIEDTYSNLSPEEVRTVLDSLSDESLKDIIKARIETGIGYKHRQYQEWIENNGLKLSEELLKRIIKAAACEVSGLEIEYYASCTIGAGQSNPSSQTEIKILDPESNATLEYNITNNTILSDAVKLLYTIQSIESATYEEVLNYTNQALNVTKLAIAAGVELEGNNIKTEKTETEAKQYILQICSTEIKEG